MRSSDKHNPGEFPDLTLPERKDGVPGKTAGPKPQHPADPHIKIQAKEETIQSPPEMGDDLRALLTHPTALPAGRTSRVPGAAAGVLAFLGALWGLYLLPDMLTGDLLNVALLGPFYLLTAGYLVRVLARPTLAQRRGLWVLSILVHGVWMCCGLFIAASGPISMEGFFGIAWWSLATALSFWALVTEGPDAPVRANEKNASVQEVIVIGIILLLFVVVAIIATVFYVVRLK